MLLIAIGMKSAPEERYSDITDEGNVAVMF